MGNNPIAPSMRAPLAAAAIRLTRVQSEDAYIAFFKEQYAAGRITLSQFERRVGKTLEGFYYGLRQ